MVVVVTDGYGATVCAANITSYTLLACEIYEKFCRTPVYSKETYIGTFVTNTTSHRTEQKKKHS